MVFDEVLLEIHIGFFRLADEFQGHGQDVDAQLAVERFAGRLFSAWVKALAAVEVWVSPRKRSSSPSFINCKNPCAFRKDSTILLPVMRICP